MGNGIAFHLLEALSNHMAGQTRRTCAIPTLVNTRSQPAFLMQQRPVTRTGEPHFSQHSASLMGLRIAELVSRQVHDRSTGMSASALPKALVQPVRCGRPSFSKG